MTHHPTQPPGHPPSDERTLHVVAFFESLTPVSLRQLPTVYSEEARFIDPFNDVCGLPAISQVFAHMFDNLQGPRFRVLQTITEGDHCFMLWDFHFTRQAGAPGQRVHGGSHLHFAPDGRVDWHRDHWDPAREIYETVPLLGSVMRWLRRRLQASA
ncbi:nuclear transport factor 2 family protein [Hydrogenophaga sp. PAMC20947]|uniref:nuclear transport factor 2 family protein n=1 Tax=Hydrogenophaga sp. PAMC20947 TaxID=2565558 RepID=UPI00109DF0FD|nr:nuclear transport factor 2 family protein [Hydrogenophaga sp. PAMC20947]QCB47296.1 nuclear transport factor 2 family protein [Hydrogenophaga sp. PAMC20947]